jgi:hypothetical protein
MHHKNEIVLIAPCRKTIGEMLQHNVYVFQNLRSMRPVKWMAPAPFADEPVRYLFQVMSRRDNVMFQNEPELRHLHNRETRGDSFGTPLAMLSLSGRRSVGPIMNDLSDASGKRYAFLSYRYVTLESVLRAKQTSELEFA